MLDSKSMKEIRIDGTFDEKWYLNRYPDVGLVGIDPLEHFLRIGVQLGRDPGPDFSTSGYLKANPDVVSSGANPLYHYIKWGRREGRQAPPAVWRSRPLKDDSDFSAFASAAVDHSRSVPLSSTAAVPEAGINVTAPHVVISTEKPGKAATAGVRPSDNYTKSQSVVSKASPLYASNDLARKLWGGFANYAESEMISLFKSNMPDKQKASMAWELARFHAADGRWDQCLTFLKRVRQYDKKQLNQKRGRLLETEASAAVGNFEKAFGLARYPLDNGTHDADFYCSLANVLSSQVDSGVISKEEGDRRRLAKINEIYSRAGLCTLTLIDQAKGFTFGNLGTSDIAAVRVPDQPKISVLMPVYGAEEFIALAVTSMLEQSWRNIEIVLVEDHSPDRSWEVIEALAKRDSRIVCVRNERNMGAYPTRNRALRLATGDFITVHDSDDWSHPQMLEMQIKAMLADPSIKASFSSMTRVSPSMRFALRPERNNMEYVHRSYPSLMIRRADLDELDCWDRIAANADDELVQRARQTWGKEALLDVMPNVPFSFFLKHPASLTSQKGTNLRSLTYGVRHEYSRQAEFWRTHIFGPMREKGIPVSMERASMKSPFPIPANLAPKDWTRNSHYDLIIISDLTLLGGTRRCNEGYIAAARKLGYRVGLFHWPRYDLRLLDDIAKEYRFLSYDRGVDIITVEEEVTAKHLIIHHPPILKFEPDAVPSIKTESLHILVNQLPRQLQSEADKYYDQADVIKRCKALFGLEPVWVPISPLVRRFLKEGGYTNLLDTDWIPPLGRSLVKSEVKVRHPQGGRVPVIGRHSRDHWTKWPESQAAIRAAYCADTPYIVRFMGGTESPRKLLEQWPSNWTDLQFDSVSVAEFLSGLDFFLHFTHFDYIEEFGRNIMEAMAHGVPVIVPERFREVFGDAAAYAEPDEVAGLIAKLWKNPKAYSALVEKGLEYVLAHADNAVVQSRIKAAVADRSVDRKVA